MCLSVCLSASVASHISETSKAIAIKFDTVTASVMRMHHVSIILTLAFAQGHTHLNHQNNKCSIISETFQTMTSKFDVKIVRAKGLYFASPTTWTFIQGHNCVSNWTTFKLLL